MRKAKSQSEPRFAYGGLSRVIHERARLSLMTSLITHAAGQRFSDLKESCALTDGNLNRHLAVLEEAKLVSVTKTAEGTWCRITAQGRKQFLAYLAVLDQVISDAADALSEHGASLEGLKSLAN